LTRKLKESEKIQEKLRKDKQKSHDDVIEFKEENFALKEEKARALADIREKAEQIEQLKSRNEQLRNSRVSPPPGFGGQVPSMSELLQNTAELKELKKNLGEMFEQKEENKISECIICMELMNDENKAIVFFPCGHARVCKTCVSSEKAGLNKPCPICRKKVLATATLYVD